MGKYVVRGTDIWTEAGRANEGETVELGGVEARHFNKLGYLAPFIEDEEPAPDEDEPSTAEEDFKPSGGRGARR